MHMCNVQKRMDMIYIYIYILFVGECVATNWVNDDRLMWSTPSLRST